MNARVNHNGHSLDPVATPCGECSAMTEMVGGDRIYPRRPDLAEKRFYLCPTCGAYVGTHPGTCQPLGNPANERTRKARSRAHAHFDALWKEVGRRTPEQRNPRKRAYRWLAARLGMEFDKCHIGMMDAADADRVVEQCLPELRRMNVEPERR